MATQVIDQQRQQQAAQINSDLAQSAEITGQPFQAQEDYLAAEVKKIGDASAERARLRSDDAKQEYDDQVRANLIRGQQQAADQHDAVERFHVNRENQDVQQAAEIAQQLASIPIAPGETAWNMSGEKLRQLSDLTQRWNTLGAASPDLNLPKFDSAIFDLAADTTTAQDAVRNLSHPLDQTQALAQRQPERGQVSHPTTFPDGSTVQIAQQPDGTLEARLITGEVFKGDPVTVTRKIGEANVNTKRWAQQQRAVAQAQPQTQQAQQPPAQPQMQQLPDQPTQAGSIAEMWAAQQAEAIAKEFGFSNKQEMIQTFVADRQQAEEMKNHMTAANFLARVPEFPDTDESVGAIEQIITQQGWEWTVDSMQAAHALAVHRGMYQPLTPEMQAAANGNEPKPPRPTAPPMIRSGNPDMTFRQADPWTMDMQELKKQAIRQQLEGSGPRQ